MSPHQPWNRWVQLSSEHRVSDGYGDVVTARFNWGSAPGILVLGHLDTVHLVGTLKESLPIRRDGDRLYGPGVMDMKGGMYLSVHALGHVLEETGRVIGTSYIYVYS